MEAVVRVATRDRDEIVDAMADAQVSGAQEVL